MDVAAACTASFFINILKLLMLHMLQLTHF